MSGSVAEGVLQPKPMFGVRNAREGGLATVEEHTDVVAESKPVLVSQREGCLRVGPQRMNEPLVVDDVLEVVPDA